MATLKETSDRIMAELRRSNIEAAVRRAIQDAIDEAAKTRFYFNEMEAPFTVTVNNPFYAGAAPRFTKIDFIAYWQNNVFGGQAMRIYPRRYDQWIAETTGSAQVGEPWYFADYRGGFALHPRPNLAYDLTIVGFGKLSALAADDDTNAWLQDGERYIRALAKSYVFKDYVRNFNEATVYAAIAEDYKQDLLNQTNQQEAGSDELQATSF